MSASAASSSQSSAASDASSSATDAAAAENSLSNPVVSEKFRLRMQPCREALRARRCCPCCGRNFLDAAECLARFRDGLLLQEQGASAAAGIAADFSDSERLILLSDSFLLRLLARCTCDFKRSQERLLVARLVHRKYSLESSVRCQVCVDSPGYHSFRQVGFDRVGRPVLYTCLNQDLETGTQPEQIKAYFVHLILTVREAEKTIPDSQHSLVLVFDTTGLGLNHVRTDTVSQFGEMLRYFPARMSYALLLNMSTVTRYLLKPIIHLTGHQDDVLILSGRQMDKQLSECFDPPLVQWMMREVEQNKQPKTPFWVGPPTTRQLLVHDPRGEASYVENYVTKRHPSGHSPHPSIVSAKSASN